MADTLEYRISQVEKQQEIHAKRLDSYGERLEAGGKTMAEHGLKIKLICDVQREQGDSIKKVASDFRAFTEKAAMERIKDSNVRTGILVTLCLNLVAVIVMILVSLGGGG